jgi:hypothetical protein
MNAMRRFMSRWGKLLGFFSSAVMLLAFALPASAGGSTKTISLSVTPTTLSATTTVVYAKITNTGNSTANSFEVDWKTSPNFTVVSATAGGSTGACSAAGRKGPGYSGCVFTKQLPVKSSVTITLTVQVTSQCSAQSINWFAYAWTGAPGPVSQSFQLNCSIPVTSVPASSCSVEFVTQPADVFIGSTITGSQLNSNGAPVSVKLLQNGAAAAAGTAVSVSASPATCATGATPVTTDASGVAQIAFAGAAPGACVLTASAAGYGSADSQQFNVVQQVGDLGCSAGNNTFGATGSGLVLNGTRLENVDDPATDAVGGSPAPDCVVVPYVVSTTCPTGFVGSCTNLVYDPLDQGTHMTFTFHWEWPPEAIPTTGIEGIHPTVQFFLNGNPVGVELDFCPEIIPVYGTGGDVTGVDPAHPPFDQDSSLPGTQAGCLISRQANQVGDQIQVTEDAYVQGDYAARRN